jgi:hypothetical protein
MLFSLLLFKIGSFLYFQFRFSGPFPRQAFTAKRFGDRGIIGFSDTNFVTGSCLSDLFGNRCQFRTLFQLFST